MKTNIVRFKEFIRFNGKGIMLCLPFQINLIIAKPKARVIAVSK